MICEKCGCKMRIAESKMVSDIGSTEVYNELKMVCPNPLCEDFCGFNPKNITKFKPIRRKVNGAITGNPSTLKAVINDVGSPI